ncbi:uncharacterized protein LOC135847960 [Planococcus citri]|uniref:uncharacterized protein LOC135847960 n=1 Tax=Planococcus citri TaxID=170843 RepID=UPI0031F7ABEE
MTMTTSSTIYAASAIFVMANLIVCVKTDPSSLEDVTITETNQYVEPLSPKIYSKDVCELLSPDMFKQADPFHYLLQKASKLTGITVIIRSNLKHYLLAKNQADQLPPAYVPYAKVLLPLLSCVDLLYSITYSIGLINNPRRKYPPPPPPYIFTGDAEVLPLFSWDIFTDPNPPSVLIEKLLQVPENSYLSIAKKLINEESFRLASVDYSLYTSFLSKFLKQETASKEVQDLRRYIGEIQKLKTSAPAVGQNEHK